jgi:hypothetical protein
MAGPLLFAVPIVGALADVGPRLAAKVVESGSEVNDAKSIINRTVTGNLKAEAWMEEMRRNAQAIQLLTK